MLTNDQKLALEWLQQHNGDGTLTKHGVVLAAGETAPFMRTTWNKLRDAGYVEFYNPAGKGYGRIRLTVDGKHWKK